ncbi:hypothetical protein CMI42_00165 [Candidatus Pacearchaeota archaeon]|jgi:stalled ribosome rescue protein Dom34|nr:hypothetical protein [Candidatus Pacearchaeota archaeon]|tara:strand:- start:1265 stop:1447 length:183 start_codon:yes stop_codon:yes gene_type:complete
MEQGPSLEKMNLELQNLRVEFERFKEDLEFARRTEEAQSRIDSGEYLSMDSENLEEMNKW